MATIDKYEQKEPKRPQLFEYMFRDGVLPGDEMIRAAELVHAICNSDRYPVEIYKDKKLLTPEEAHDREVEEETLDAVLAAADAVPRYVARSVAETELEFFSPPGNYFTPGGSSLIRCQKCRHEFGTILRSDENFCPKCGGLIKDPEKWRSLPQ